MTSGEDQSRIVDMAERFARESLRAGAAEWEAAGSISDDVVAEIGELGMLGMLVPEEWGGAGLDYGTYALVIEALAAGDAAASTLVTVHNSVCCLPVLNFGTVDQKRRFLPDLASGRTIGAFCLTEPGAGSDVAAISARARRAGDEYVLSGEKQFITNGRRAGLAIVFAVTDPQAGKKGISAFLVPCSTPGYRVARVEDKLGLRGSDTAQIILEDCRVPESLLLGGEGEGLKIALGNLEGGRIGIAAQAVGIARAGFEAALAYARERKTFGVPLIEHQAIAFRLAEMATSIEAARALTQAAAHAKDSGRPALKLAAMAKMNASDMAEKVVSEALQIFGGQGYIKGSLVERLYRDVGDRSREERGQADHRGGSAGAMTWQAISVHFISRRLRISGIQAPMPARSSRRVHWRPIQDRPELAWPLSFARSCAHGAPSRHRVPAARAVSFRLHSRGAVLLLAGAIGRAYGQEAGARRLRRRRRRRQGGRDTGGCRPDRRCDRDRSE
jgi:alkylation response protein AidB-like acyl-CoA dehydrogenase